MSSEVGVVQSSYNFDIERLPVSLSNMSDDLFKHVLRIKEMSKQIFNYQVIGKDEARAVFSPSEADRFKRITEREDRSDFLMPTWETLWEKTFLQTWNGIFHDRGMFELGLFPVLIAELRPKTVIELGALDGGGAVWFADHLNAFHIDGTVYSVDIDLSLLHEKARADKRIRFIEGDCNDMARVFSSAQLSAMPHPWLILEDCHVNTTGIMDFFHHHGLQSGDYMIIEDTNKYVPAYWGSRWHNPSEIKRIENKLDNVRLWLDKYPDDYLVDTYYLDMYGYNVSKNWNSVFKRV